MGTLKKVQGKLRDCMRKKRARGRRGLHWLNLVIKYRREEEGREVVNKERSLSSSKNRCDD